MIIVSTAEDLRKILREEISNVVPELANFRRKNEKMTTDNLTIDEAVIFLGENGYPTTKKTIYSLIFHKQIPYRKVGRRVVMSKKELGQWITERSYNPTAKSEEATLRIAKSARLKDANA